MTTTHHDSAQAMDALSLRSRIRSGIFFNLVGTAFNQGSTFFVNIILANLLGRFSFGEYAMIQATLAPLILMAQLATGITATKYVAEYRSTDRHKTGRIIGLLSMVSIAVAGLMSLGLLIGAKWIAALALNAPHLVFALRLGSGVVLFSAISGFQMGALAGLESYRSLAKAGVVSGSLYLLVCGVAAWFWGLNGAVLGLLVSAILQWLVLRHFLALEKVRHGLALRYKNVASERDIVFRFAVPAAAAGYFSSPAIWLANAILVHQPGGYIQMALYSAATTIRVLVLFVPNIMNTVGVSILNHSKGSGDSGRYKKTFLFNLAIIASTAVVAAATASLAGKLILMAFGKDFTEGYPVLITLLASTVPESLTIGLYQHIQAQERMWLSFFAIVVPRESTLVIASLFLTPAYGAQGLAISYLIASFVGLTFTALISVFLRRSHKPDVTLQASS
ncbi:MAG: oligosaccharide flippase family protein [Acidiferrobacterales bacterium]